MTRNEVIMHAIAGTLTWIQAADICGITARQMRRMKWRYEVYGYDGLVDGFYQAIYGNDIKVRGGNVQIHAVGYKASAGQTPLLPLADDIQVLEVARAQPACANGEAQG